MANRYLDSNAVGANDGTTKADAFTTLAAASAVAVNGDFIWVSDAHAESSASLITWNPSGTSMAHRVYIICVDFAGSTPPVEADLSSGATVTTTGSARIDLLGCGIFFGITFSSAAQIRLTDNSDLIVMINCKLITTSTSSSMKLLSFDQADNRLVMLINTPFKFANAGQLCDICGNFFWLDTPNAIDPAGSIPNQLFEPNNQHSGPFFIEGIDLTNLGSSLIFGDTKESRGGFAYLRRCKIAAGAVIATNTMATSLMIIDYDNLDDGTDAYRHGRFMYPGNQVIETTIVRTGGAEVDGTSYAWKITTGSAADKIRPFVSRSIFVHLPASESTVTIHGTWGGGAVPNNDDIWPEIRHMGATVIGVLENGGLANLLDTEVAWDADGGSTWGGGTTDFTMSLTFTPGIAGIVEIVIKAALPSTVFYVDPYPVVT